MGEADGHLIAFDREPHGHHRIDVRADHASLSGSHARARGHIAFGRFPSALDGRIVEGRTSDDTAGRRAARRPHNREDRRTTEETTR